MTQYQLMLNDDKTEFLIIGTRQQLSKVSIQSIKVGQAEVSSVVSARNLGTWFDAHLDMRTFITKTCSSAFYYLCNIRHIRRRGGLIVSALDSGSSDPGSSLGRGTALCS